MKLLKNLYNLEYIELLCSNIELFDNKFDSKIFIETIFDDDWINKELKERMSYISSTLYLHMPSNYKSSMEILKNVFSKMNYAYSLENMIFQDYVEQFGMNDFDISMNALEHFTVNSSSEFAIRRFIIKFPHATMKQMKLWTTSDNHHLRRLASEGCRPRLPWAIALSMFKNNPKEVLEILNILKNDESEYVRKSVANNLNDISKDNPLTIIKLSKKWHNNTKNTDWILKHGCRTLLKSSNKEILNIFGFYEPTHILLKDFHMPSKIATGEELLFSFTLKSQKALGKIRVEYAIDFLRQNNKYNTKVFKISESISNQNIKNISKNYSFKQISTRVYYKGLHKLSIIINGTIFLKKEFILF